MRKCAGCPKQLVLSPDNENIFWGEGERDNLEFTQLLNSQRLWLRWLFWYFHVPLGGDPSFEDLFRPLISAHSWKGSTFDKDVKMYGVLWKCWDLGENWSIGTTPVGWRELSPVNLEECRASWTPVRVCCLCLSWILY